METSSEGNLLEIIDLAHSLRQEHLYITNEQHMFLTLNETLIKNSSNVAQVNICNCSNNNYCIKWFIIIIHKKNEDNFNQP